MLARAEGARLREVLAVKPGFRERLRAFELELQRRMPEFRCSVHLCLGQEDVPCLLEWILRPEDYLFSTHRSHGHYLAKGGTEQKLLDEILGLPTGVNGGFSGSQSFCDPALRFHSTAIVGGLVGVATGTALGVKLAGGKEIVVCCIGEAATEQGVFWESLNFAALHALPIVYVCENNGLSVHAPVAARQSTPLAGRVRAFGIEYFRHVWGAQGAIEIARRHRVPGFAEVPCKRACNHVSAMEDLREAA
jgi:TPP-dependent pyruvate/acetoin dehydrogenase alpha subunit